MLIILLPLCVPSIHVRNEYLQGKPILSASFVALPAYFKLVYSMFALSKVYLVLSMIPTLVGMAVLWRRDAAYRSMNVPRMGYLFAMLIVLSNMVSIAGDLVSMSLVRFSVIMANISMCSVYLVTQRHPDYNRLLRSETRKAQYERSRIQGLDIDRITERLRELMEEEKAYRDEELSLQDLSRELGIGPHQLSQILNERLGKNFNTYVNEYRVKEAKRLILEEPDRSILSIGFASGFNSNTTFTTVFSKLTGASPGQYRKLLGKSSPR
jgi:AraC-like DNA-binding protein